MKAFVSGLALFCLAVLAVESAVAADLRINVTGLRSGSGTVHVGLFSGPDGFLTKEGMHADTVVEARPGGVQAVFDGLPPGSYAVATYHDENDNGEFDQGLFGIPLEGFALSNGVRPVLSAPEFHETAVSLGDQGTEIVLNMGY